MRFKRGPFPSVARTLATDPDPIGSRVFIAIKADSISRIIINNSDFFGLTKGVVLEDIIVPNHQCKIYNSTFTDIETAIELKNVNGLVLQNSTISGNTPYALNTGIKSENSFVYMKGGVIKNCKEGIRGLDSKIFLRNTAQVINNIEPKAQSLPYKYP